MPIPTRTLPTAILKSGDPALVREPDRFECGPMFTVLVDPERCIGCLQCEFACAVEHSRSADATLAISQWPLPRKRVHVGAGTSAGTSFPNKCRHCDPAPCQLVCPTGAISRDVDHDAVLIDTSRCIGCAMCAIVCPFDVLTFHSVDEGAAPVAVKCDGCVDRLRAGRRPACVDACKTGALTFGDVNDLVGARRHRNAAAILAATSREPAARLPEHVVMWRQLGGDHSSSGGAR